MERSTRTRVRAAALVPAATLLSLALAWAPASAQVTLRPGETVNGRLEASDPVLEDGSHYDLYFYRGQPGETVTLTMRSGDFDAYLNVGTLEGADFVMVDFDDDGGGGTDARLTVTVDGSGLFAIRANALSEGQTGSYTLAVETAGATGTGAPAALRPIAAGQIVEGALGPGDPRLDDGSYYHLYRYQGTAGESLVITMRSGAVDAYLASGTMVGASFVEDGSDDDGAGGTDALLSVTVGADGVLVIRAGSFGADDEGGYTLSVQPGAAAGAR